MPATKDEIARTFSGLVARFGYRRTAVEDVARALRISKKTVYDSFSSKEDLYRYAIELWATEQRARVESMLSAPTALGRIEQASSIAFADVRRGLEAAPGADTTEPPEIAAEVNERVFGPLIRDLIVQGNAAGEFAVADPETTAAFAVAIGVEAVQLHV
jgi:AcrR family transcriptional regulator